MMPESRKKKKAKKKKLRQRRIRRACYAGTAIILILLVIWLIAGRSADKEENTYDVHTSPVNQETVPQATESVQEEATAVPDTGDAAEQETQEQTETDDAAVIQTTAAPDVDIPLAIYIPISGSQNRRIVNGFGSEWATGRDIDCFEVLLSEEKEEPGDRFYQIFERLWDDQEAARDRRIGYELTLTMKDGSQKWYSILAPEDTEGELFQYVECYLYDDIHQNGAWNYYHLLPSNMKESTLMTSVKLHGGKQIDQVADMELKAFLYRDEGDFDAEGRYVGINFWAIGIHRK